MGVEEIPTGLHEGDETGDLPVDDGRRRLGGDVPGPEAGPSRRDDEAVSVGEVAEGLLDGRPARRGRRPARRPSHPEEASRSATASPPRSSRMPAATPSLTVSTAARRSVMGR